MKRWFVIAAVLLFAPHVHADEPPLGVWYYCDSTMTYYPRVLVCKEGFRVERAIPPNAPPPSL